MDKFRVHPQVPNQIQVCIAGVWFDLGTTKYAEEARDACDEFLAACRNLRT